jgi:hypothetical protein
MLKVRSPLVASDMSITTAGMDGIAHAAQGAGGAAQFEQDGTHRLGADFQIPRADSCTPGGRWRWW